MARFCNLMHTRKKNRMGIGSVEMQRRYLRHVNYYSCDSIDTRKMSNCSVAVLGHSTSTTAIPSIHLVNWCSWIKSCFVSWPIQLPTYYKIIRPWFEATNCAFVTCPEKVTKCASPTQLHFRSKYWKVITLLILHHAEVLQRQAGKLTPFSQIYAKCFRGGARQSEMIRQKSSFAQMLRRRQLHTETQLQ